MRANALSPRRTDFHLLDVVIVAVTVLAVALAVLIARGASPLRRADGSGTAATGTSASTASNTSSGSVGTLRLEAEGRYPAGTDTFAIGPSLRGSVLVTNPADASAYRYLDLQLTAVGSSASVAGARVHASARMNGMAGSTEVDALSRGDGHYFLPMQLPMPGTWQVNVTISNGGQEQTLPLQVVAR